VTVDKHPKGNNRRKNGDVPLNGHSSNVPHNEPEKRDRRAPIIND